MMVDPPRPAIDRLLESERATYRRLEPLEAAAALDRGAVLIDTRSHEQRAVGGIVPGSIRIHRNVLEWRVDPTSAHRDPRVSVCKAEIIVMCEQGFSSSLAAALLRRLGVDRATDVVGGFEAWRSAGLPVEPLE